ncbi:hypothetical protein [Nocardia xishanensis]|uniref:hypothetical protein n=1 Tax=Nocardia xishanensis TaxID=238964 RepID=UPI0034465BD1
MSNFPAWWPGSDALAARLTSREFGYDRGEPVGEVGAEDEIGEADLLLSPLDFLGGGRRIIRKYGQVAS